MEISHEGQPPMCITFSFALLTIKSDGEFAESRKVWNITKLHPHPITQQQVKEYFVSVWSYPRQITYQIWVTSLCTAHAVKRHSGSSPLHIGFWFPGTRHPVDIDDILLIDGESRCSRIRRYLRSSPVPAARDY